MYLIQFTAFLNDSGYNSYIPVLPRAYKSTFTPYIFSAKEIEEIFAVSDRLEMGNFMDSTVNVIPAILRLLYGTGIRVGEAVSLKLRDVNLDERYLVISQSKNGKERMVPFSDSLAEVLRQYRNSLHTVQAPESFFLCQAQRLPVPCENDLRMVSQGAPGNGYFSRRQGAGSPAPRCSPCVQCPFICGDGRVGVRSLLFAADPL